MKTTLVLGLAALALAACYFGSQQAVALTTSTYEGCSMLTHTSGFGTNSYQLHDADELCDADARADAAMNITAGTCRTATLTTSFGANGPSGPTGLNAYLYPENLDTNHGATGQNAWTSYRAKYVLPTTAGTSSLTVCATSDGTVSGTPRIGTYRLVLRVCSYTTPTGDGCQGGASTYDFNNDFDSSGGNPGAGNSIDIQRRGVWRAGFTPACWEDARSLGGADEDLYVPSDVPYLRVCSLQPAATHVGTAFRVSTRTHDGASEIAATYTERYVAQDVDGALPAVAYLDAYVDGTTPQKRVQITNNSLIHAKPWTVFLAAPMGSTLVDYLTIDAPLGLIEKDLTVTCPTKEHPTNPSQTVSVYHAKETVKCRDGTVRDGRGAPLGSGQHLRVTYRHASRAVGSTLDAASCDTTTGSSGAWTCDSETTTTPYSSHDAEYRVDIRLYQDNARTVELSRGTADGDFDVRTDFHMSAPQTWLNECGTGAVMRTFVVAADVICQRNGPVTNQRGETPPSLSFQTDYMENASSETIGPFTTPGVTTGTEPDFTVNPQPPSSSAWVARVRATDGNGNVAETWTTFTFVSPYTSIRDILCMGSTVPTPPGGSFNMTCQTVERSSFSSVLEPKCPDEAPYYRINATRGGTGEWLAAVPTSTPPANGAEPCTYWVNWTVPEDYVRGDTAIAVLTANMSGQSISASYPLTIMEETGSDPLHLDASYSWDTHKATLTATASYGNGTRRTGIAQLLQGACHDPNDEQTPIALSWGERSPGVYVARPYLGISPARGDWFCHIEAPQPVGQGWATAAAGFSVGENLTLAFLDQRQLTLDLWSALRAAEANLKAALRAEAAVTNTLVNATKAFLSDELDNATSEILAAIDGVNATVHGEVVVEWHNASAAKVFTGYPVLMNASANSTGAWQPFYFAWDFGDRTTGQGPAVYHAWTKAGTYEVQLWSMTARGHGNASRALVTVEDAIPVLNVTGPRVVKQGERAIFTTGTSYVPYGEAAYTFVANPKKVDTWLTGTRYLNSGYCGPVNATDVRGPDFDSLTIGPIGFSWELAKKDTCTTWDTRFARTGEHVIQLRAVTPQGIVKTIDYHVTVLPATHGVTSGDTKETISTVPNRANEGAGKVLDAINWLIGLLTPGPEWTTT